MATANFTTWLNKQLTDLNTDVDIFGSYITGILEGDETPDEKREALNDILSEIIDSNLDVLVNSILEKWQEMNPQDAANAQKQLDIDVNEKLAKLLEAQKLQITTKERQYTEEEKRVREQILAQYSQTEVSDEDAQAESDDQCDSKPTASSLSGIERNTNVQDVIQLQKERREQSRMDSAAKKLKDKTDRERQKQLREEKKEKRKTVKGERKR